MFLDLSSVTKNVYLAMMGILLLSTSCCKTVESPIRNVQLELEGQWSLDSKFTTDVWLKSDVDKKLYVLPKVTTFKVREAFSNNGNYEVSGGILTSYSGFEITKEGDEYFGLTMMHMIKFVRNENENGYLCKVFMVVDNRSTSKEEWELVGIYKRES